VTTLTNFSRTKTGATICKSTVIGSVTFEGGNKVVETL